MGGLARRATLFNDFREQSAAPLFFLNGGNTFTGQDGAELEKSVAKAMVTGFERLDYDLGMLTPEEKALLDSNNLHAPRAWMPVGVKPETKVVTKGGIRFGLVLLADPEGLPAAKDAAHGLKADLLVLVSALGISAEKDLMDAADNPFHLLLGGGPGTGVNGKISDNAHCLWLRSYPKGKAVQLIDILALPGADGWQKKVNVNWQTKPLKDTIADDPDMAALLADLP